MIVKLNLNRDADGEFLTVTSKENRTGVSFRLNADNSKHIKGLLGNRLIMFAICRKDEDQLNIICEAPFQIWDQ